VGIWDGSVQFRLSRAQVLEIVRLLLEAKVGAMPQPGAKPSAGAARKAPLQMRGDLLVVAGSERTQLQQLTRGEQSEALSRLVTRLLELSEKAAAGGIRASSLQDGLAKVGDGTLAPQTFLVLVRRQTTAGSEGDSFLLRVEGLRASDRLMPKDRTPPPARELTLTDVYLRKLALAIRAQDPASLAKTTYAPTYTDVTIAVLDHERNVPARPYLDVTPETHGEKQKAFDRLYAMLRELHERVQKDGTPAAAAAPVTKPASQARP
jgi:hypothetical protein